MPERRLRRVVDLRGENPGWIIEMDRCRDVAADLRQRGVEALLVPSVAFVDRPERLNVVIFAERLWDLDKAITKPRRVLSILPVPG